MINKKYKFNASYLSSIILVLTSISIYLTGCVTPSNLSQGNRFANTNIDIAKKIAKRSDFDNCESDFRRNNPNEDIKDFSRIWMTPKLLNLKTSSHLLHTGQDDLASKIVVYQTKVNRNFRLLALREHEFYVFCFYKIQNNQLVFLESCIAGRASRCKHMLTN